MSIKISKFLTRVLEVSYHLKVVYLFPAGFCPVARRADGNDYWL